MMVTKRPFANRILLTYRVNYLSMPFVLGCAVLNFLTPAMIIFSLQWMVHLLLSFAILFIRNHPKRSRYLLWLSGATLGGYLATALTAWIGYNGCVSIIPGLVSFITTLTLLLLYGVNAGYLYNALVVRLRTRQVLGCAEHREGLNALTAPSPVGRMQLTLVSCAVTVSAISVVVFGLTHLLSCRP